jgi:phosphoglycerate dehydrogenase-like enzyme
MNQRRIWTNMRSLGPDAAALRQRLFDKYQVVVATPSSLHARGLEGAEIAFGQPDPQQVMALPELRWCQLSSAGYTKYDREDLRKVLRARGAILTNSSAVYADPCAQHVLAMMLALARRLPQSHENQRRGRAWPTHETRSRCVLLTGQKVLLVGFGAIARRLLELLAPFGMEIVGVRREVRGDEPIRMIPIDRLDELLGWTDHIVNLLPASASTNCLFDPDRFRKMKRSAIFYNIGRGDTIDQTALRVALETECLAAAYVDVAMPEPLPCDDALWATPNCHITPHAAGGHSNETDRLVEHFVENLNRFERGENLRDRII